MLPCIVIFYQFYDLPLLARWLQPRHILRTKICPRGDGLGFRNVSYLGCFMFLSWIYYATSTYLQRYVKLTHYACYQTVFYLIFIKSNRLTVKLQANYVNCERPSYRDCLREDSNIALVWQQLTIRGAHFACKPWCWNPQLGGRNGFEVFSSSLMSPIYFKLEHVKINCYLIVNHK